MSMWKYVLKRMCLALMTSFIILSLSYLLIKCLPFERAIGMADDQYAYYETQVRDGFVVRFDVSDSRKQNNCILL